MSQKIWREGDMGRGGRVDRLRLRRQLAVEVANNSIQFRLNGGQSAESEEVEARAEVSSPRVDIASSTTTSSGTHWGG
jgi:hypothetical protein